MLYIYIFYSLLVNERKYCNGDNDEYFNILFIFLKEKINLCAEEYYNVVQSKKKSGWYFWYYFKDRNYFK